MSLTRKLEIDELDLLELLEDPVWLPEFLRSTADGSPHKEEWPKRPFSYRWYQRDLITDRSPFISLVAGRAVGKCQPWWNKIYTTEGYKKIQQLRELDCFGLYALNDNGEIVQRRAKIVPNGVHPIFKVVTDSGFKFEGTKNHPILTERGWVEIQDIKEGDGAAVMTSLPHPINEDTLSWFELRYLGYITGYGLYSTMKPVKLRYQKQVAEWKAIAKVFDATLVEEPGNIVYFTRKVGPLKFFTKVLFKEIGWQNAYTNGIRVIPEIVKRQKLENIAVFLEAFFSQYADITSSSISVKLSYTQLTLDIQELLLYFGVETTIQHTERIEDTGTHDTFILTVRDYRSLYRFFQSFKLPGISAGDLPLPDKSGDPNPNYRFDRIKEVSLWGPEVKTYGIFVWTDHNYITQNIIVHNSLVLEDKIINESVNPDLYFPETKEQTLVTANTSQMTPILDRLIMRFSHSSFLKDFLRGNINRSKGTMDFPLSSGSHLRINARIAGSRGENNMVGLHVPKIKGDEMQLFPMPAWIQMQPTFNSWEKGSNQFFCGVPNGLREGNVLYFLDQVSTKYKRYRIPAHQNPFFTMKDNIESIKQYGGEDSEDYQHLVLGRHGTPAYAVIPRDSMRTEPFDFYSYRYSGNDKAAGKHYLDVLGLPKLDPKYTQSIIFSIDTGFADPTIIQVMGYGKDGKWRPLIRYRLTRIPFPEQAAIIAWLDNQYNANKIAIDLGAGGGGIGIMQDLMSDRFPKSRRYDQRLLGVRFNDQITVGEDPNGEELRLQVKSFAGQQIAKMVAEQEIVFSEVDSEGMSQLERVAYQRNSDGSTRYFVLSDRGAGVSKDDHIFASYVVFIACLTTMSVNKPVRKLFGAKWI